MIQDATLTLTDPVYVAKPNLGGFDKFLAKFIRDIRDLPFLKLSLLGSTILIPWSIFIFVSPNFYWSLGILYLAVLFMGFLGPYILMLHNFSHRPLFKKEYQKIEKFLVWGLGPLCGQTPETYYVHHVGMHHVEENLPKDLSCTMMYRRDSLWDFTKYFSRFYFLSIYHLSRYLKKRKRNKLFDNMILGELSWYLIVGLLTIYHWQAALVVFIIPLVITRFMMMNGNWAQHAFICQNNPSDPYLSSITCINSRYNRTCFNDGYHIGHHLKATRHWTDMPEDFLKNKSTYLKRASIVFEGLDYFQIWIFLMLKRYDWLAKHFVNLDPNHPLSQNEIIQLLKSRTLPFSHDDLLKWS